MNWTILDDFKVVIFVNKNTIKENQGGIYMEGIGKVTAISIICKDCKNSFIMGQKEIRWYSNMGFPLPKRCPECLAKRKSREYKEYRNGILDPRD